jgi:GxxExxY protein
MNENEISQIEWELRNAGLSVKRQVEVPVRYKSIVLPVPLRLDPVVEDLVIVECKATLDYHPVFESLSSTCLRVTGMHLGLSVNFGFPVVARGISRVVNKLNEEALVRPEITGARRSAA